MIPVVAIAGGVKTAGGVMGAVGSLFGGQKTVGTYWNRLQPIAVGETLEHGGYAVDQVFAGKLNTIWRQNLTMSYDPGPNIVWRDAPPGAWVQAVGANSPGALQDVYRGGGSTSSASPVVAGVGGGGVSWPVLLVICGLIFVVVKA